MRDQMTQALKKVVIPLLRERDFIGSFPHFRRFRRERIDLITFQFDRHGGGFIIEIAQCEPKGFTTHWGEEIPPKNVRAWDLPPKLRARIGPKVGMGRHGWFRFDNRSPTSFMRTADSVVPFLEPMERMFDDFSQVPKVG